MDKYNIYQRHGEFLEEYYGKDTWYLSLTGSHFPNDIKISFVSYDVVDHYRGEDSGAIYSEFGGPNPIVTYGISRQVQSADHLGISVSSMIEHLIADKAERTPFYRHYDLVSFLIGRPDLIISDNGINRESFIQRCLGIVSYAELNFAIPTFSNSDSPQPLMVKKDDLLVAEYDIEDIYTSLYPRNKVYRLYPIDINNYPVYFNFELMSYLKVSPQVFPNILLSCNRFDNFARFVE